MFCTVLQHEMFTCVCTCCNTQTNARHPDLKHRTTNSPFWLEEKLQCRGHQPTAYSKDVELSVNERMTTVKEIHLKVDVLTVNDSKDAIDDVTLVASLKVCAKKKDLHRGSSIHTYIIERGLLKENVFVGSALVSMYTKCGALDKAQEVFDELSIQNIVLWNALIAGYAQHQHGEKALECFEQLQLGGLSPNAVTFVCILKACGTIGALVKGQEIHAQIVREHSLGGNILVANSLIDMYAKCGSLGKAQEVFDKLLVQDVVSWTVLIAGYAQHGHGDDAISCFEQMQLMGFSPDAVTFACVLKACGSIGALDKGRNIHAQILRERSLLETNIVLANALVDMYAKCGVLEKAQEVFDALSDPNVVSWNVLIGGYAQHGHGEEALCCFKRMQVAGFFPDAVTFTFILKACSAIRALKMGEEIHAQILRERLIERDVVVANALVDMYIKCGALEKAQEVFDELPVRDLVSWNVLIAGYAEHEHSEEAVKCFDQMQVGGFAPNAVTFACILKACSSIGDLDKGQDIHAQIVREHLLEKDIVVANALIDLYAKCGSLEKAQAVFDELTDRNQFSWVVLIAGYSLHGHYEEALSCFKQMHLEGLLPDAVTFACTLKACGSIEALDKGQEIHAEVVKDGFLEQDIVVANALIDMYAKCGTLEKGQKVFDELRIRDIVSWNALIAGYAQHRHAMEVLNCIKQMQAEGLSPDAVTFACILKACGTIEAFDKGQAIHAQILKKHLLETDVVLASALVNMYAQCGALEKAQKVFDELPVWNVVSWTALINGYVQHGLGEEALNCFERMHLEGVSPNAVTFSCILRACSSVGAADKGQRLHAAIVRQEHLETDMVVGIALVVMYAKCGMLAQAEEFFDKLLVHDVVSWSALLGGYSQLGKDEIVLSLFDKMIGEGVEPDNIAFTIVLNTCSHRGLLDKGQTYFEMISKAYNIMPTLEHHTCIIDLFSRAGHLDKAVALIEKMPRTANLVIWENFLGACKKWGNMKLGRWAFEHAVQLDGKDAATYVYMSNIYAAAGRQDDAGRMEAVRLRQPASKNSGPS